MSPRQNIHRHAFAVGVALVVVADLGTSDIEADSSPMEVRSLPLAPSQSTIPLLNCGSGPTLVVICCGQAWIVAEASRASGATTWPRTSQMGEAMPKFHGDNGLDYSY